MRQVDIYFGEPEWFKGPGRWYIPLGSVCRYSLRGTGVVESVNFIKKLHYYKVDIHFGEPEWLKGAWVGIFQLAGNRRYSLRGTGVVERLIQWANQLALIPCRYSLRATGVVKIRESSANRW